MSDEPQAEIRRVGRWTYSVSISHGITRYEPVGGWLVLGRRRAVRKGRVELARYMRNERRREDVQVVTAEALEADDMARFWPDKTPKELAAAHEAIRAAGGQMVVSTQPAEPGTVSDGHGNTVERCGKPGCPVKFDRPGVPSCTCWGDNQWTLIDGEGAQRG